MRAAICYLSPTFHFKDSRQNELETNQIRTTKENNDWPNKTQENEAFQLPQPDFVKIKVELYKNLMRLNEELEELHQRLLSDRSVLEGASFRADCGF